jgi:hypothetical protein
MKTNVGSVDRAIRIIAAIVLVSLFATGVVTGKLGLALAILGVGLGITGLLKFCGIYALLGINTCCSDREGHDGCCCKK